MDGIADALGMDRLELRPVNYLRTGDTTSTGQPVETAAWLEETATRAPGSAGREDRALGRAHQDRPGLRLLLPELRAHHLAARHLPGLGRRRAGRDGGRARRRARPGRGADQQPGPDRGRGAGRAAGPGHGLPHRLGADAALRHLDRDAAALHVGQRHAPGRERGAQGAGRAGLAAARRGAGADRPGRRNGLRQGQRDPRARRVRAAGRPGATLRRGGPAAGQPGAVQGAVQRSARPGDRPGPRLPRLHLRRDWRARWRSTPRPARSPC